jgi:hypothetical protein
MVIFHLLPVSPSQAQSNLVPGNWGEFTNYDQALRTVFSEAYVPYVYLRVQTQSKYGIEIMTGVRSDSSGYTMFQLEPEDNVWSSSYVEFPCLDSNGNELPARPGSTCLRQDFSSVDTIRVSRVETPIPANLAQKLTTLWQEMLVRSSYLNQPSGMSTGGVTYTYSAFLDDPGFVSAYSRNPDEGTLTGQLEEITLLLGRVVKQENVSIKDSLIHQIDMKTDGLLAALLDNGGALPLRSGATRTLKGCTPENSNLVENEYCWQGYLTNDGSTTLLIANNVSGSYYFELVDVSDTSEPQKVHVIPSISIHGTLKMDQNFPGWQNYIMEPWDIVDLMTNTQNNVLHVFGYRDFTLKNENINYGKDSVIIHFDGLFSRRDKREVLQIDGEHGWFSIRGLFQE